LGTYLEAVAVVDVVSVICQVAAQCDSLTYLLWLWFTQFGFVVCENAGRKVSSVDLLDDKMCIFGMHARLCYMN